MAKKLNYEKIPVALIYRENNMLHIKTLEKNVNHYEMYGFILTAKQQLEEVLGCDGGDSD